MVNTNDPNIEIDFRHLSSGETTLMALVAVLYNSSLNSEAAYFPELLLLDEVDAFLHPSVLEKFINIIEQQFVMKLGMKVILVTHSMTTVALAPSNSLYVMEREGERIRIDGKSRDEALSYLSYGIIPLSDWRVGEVLNSREKVILLVEGESDKVHIETAKNRLEWDFDFDIFSCDGADRLKQFLMGVPDNILGNKIIVGIFDNDSEGRGGFDQPSSEGSKVRKLLIPFSSKEMEKFNYCPIEFLYDKSDIDSLTTDNFLQRRDPIELSNLMAKSGQHPTIHLEELKVSNELHHHKLRRDEKKGEKTKAFKTGKVEFAKNVSNKLKNIDSFRNFNLLFDLIKKEVFMVEEARKLAEV